MRDIKVLRVYNLVDSKGNKLQLRLGILRNRNSEVCISNADKGYRWSFVGDNIPMPVRSMYWFNGFEESIMLDWLKGNGWYPHTRVEMSNSRVTVYELPKGNEDSGHRCSAADEAVFKSVIRDLTRNGNKIEAVRIYKYAHGGTLKSAVDAVNVIITE